MNIVLTQKDADLIIRYFRNKLEILADCVADAQKKYNLLLKLYGSDERLKGIPKVDKMISEANKAYEELKEAFSKDRLELIHFIELLTVGSEVA